MDDHTPTTEDVRDGFAWLCGHGDEDGYDESRARAFDRWLMEVRAEAWLEGEAAGWRAGATTADSGVEILNHNPYRPRENYPKSLPELTPEQIRKAAAADAPPYRPRENYLKDLRD